MKLQFQIQFDREEDGRVIAEIVELPGVMAYGASQEEAKRAVMALALQVLADELSHGEREFVGVDFAPAA